jgi:NAD(P)-dependent dehydrogenase (short-subunit alcohol dehydrogenase family)
MDLVAIVTASTEGIGLAIARKLASDGAKVMISSRKVRKIIYLLSHPNPFYSHGSGYLNQLLKEPVLNELNSIGTGLTKILIILF